jgi:hypothetical protein
MSDYKRFLPLNGSATTTSISADRTLTALSTRLQAITATTSNLSVLFPDATTMETGGPVFVIQNAGIISFSVKNSAATLLTVVPPGQSASFYLVNNGTSAGIWVVRLIPTAVAAFSYGSVTTINAVATCTALTVAVLSSTQAIAIYTQSGLRARTLNFSGSDITMGPELLINSGVGVLCSGVCAMNPTQAIVTYVISGGVLNVATLNVTGGTTLFLGAVLAPTTSGGLTGANVCATTDTTALVVYYSGTAATTRAMTLAMSGTTLTNGLESNGVTGGANAGFPMVRPLSPTLCISARRWTGLDVVTITISGTTATINTSLLAGPANGLTVAVVELTATTAIGFAATSATGGYPVTAYLLSIAGTTITVTSSIVISGDSVAGNWASYGASLVRVSATQVVVLQPSGIVGTGPRTILLTVVGSKIIESVQRTIGATSALTANNGPQVAVVSGSQMVGIFVNNAGFPVACLIEVAP